MEEEPHFWSRQQPQRLVHHRHRHHNNTISTVTQHLMYDSMASRFIGAYAVAEEGDVTSLVVAYRRIDTTTLADNSLGITDCVTTQSIDS